MPRNPPVLVIGTTNPGKMAEIRNVLDGLPLRLLSLADLPAIAEPDETGATFAENARLKARIYAETSGLPTVAEDSGLAIDALGGRPGIQSARYPGATYADKFDRIYAEIAGAPRPWTARFVCSLALVDTARALGLDEAFGCEETVEGEIAPSPSGAGGFGYDPIFFYPPYGATLASVEPQRKMAVSHRGKAFRRLRDYLDRAGRDRDPSR
jgi:XTP/dITP diphosphohydrolase